MNGIIIPKVRLKSDIGNQGNFIVCSCCRLSFELPEIEEPAVTCSSVAVGIHRLVRYESETPELMQYHDREWSPLIREVFIFCPLRSPFMVERFFLIVAECTDMSYEYLLTKPDMPKLIPGLGHHITLIEYVPGRLGRYFNVQVDKATYRKIILEYVPANIIDFHRGEMSIRKLLWGTVAKRQF